MNYVADIVATLCVFAAIILVIGEPDLLDAIIHYVEVKTVCP